MNNKLLLISLLSFAPFISNGQNYKKLISRIQAADSVQLISHEVTSEYGVLTPDWDKTDTSMNLEKWRLQHPPSLNFLDSGKINKKIIVEKSVLSISDRLKLTNILSQKSTSDRYNEISCDEPRHTIIIYKGAKQSYLDICFGCEKIHTSSDIRFSESDMTPVKWKDLKAFFKKKGLTEIFKKYDE